MSTLIDRDRLAKAAGYITDHGWTQGEYSTGDGKVCLHGAVRSCVPVDGDTEIIRAVLRNKGFSEDWNDEPGRTADEVIQVLQAIEITDADLEATFGPQWEPIIALVRRAAALTLREAQDLAAARVAARDAWDAARGAAWDAAWDAARGAAGAAARALSVRDLSGQHGFTQAHYDTLTGPWVQVIGPVHPDDTVIHPGVEVPRG